MDCSEISPKKRKLETNDYKNSIFVNDRIVSQNLNGQVYVTHANSTTNYRDFNINGLFLSRFLDRLKLRTIPHISPLLERLSEAENKNISALKSIDKINKRIKELEFHVEQKIKTVPTSSLATGTDITDQNSDEYKRIINSLQSSPFAPFKPPTSPACKPNDNFNKEVEIRQPATFKQAVSPTVPMPQNNGHTIDLTTEDINSMNRTNGINQPGAIFKALQPKSKQLNIKLDVLSAQFLPGAPITNLLSAPRLTWSLVKDGICLQWDIQFIDPSINPNRYEICSFQKSEVILNNFPWKKIGEVAALPLPMACTLTYVSKMNTYFFAIRAWISNDVSSVWSNVIMVEIN